MQITAWLKRHDGRPGVAQSSMSEQLVDVPVTSSREAEAAAYEVGITLLPLCRTASYSSQPLTVWQSDEVVRTGTGNVRD